MNLLSRPLLLLLLCFLINREQLFSQCSPDKNYTSPGLYPDVLASAVVGQFYSQDVTIVFFKDTTQSGITCTADKFEIYGLAGLPPGMTWQSNSGSDTYYPQNNLYGCVNISGTALVAGKYTLIASGMMTLGGDALCPTDNPATYEVPFEVTAASAANAAFTISAVNGCAPLTIDFETSNNLTGSYTYLWEFGDANNTASVVENPSFTYTEPGTYVISQTATNVDPVIYYLAGLTIKDVPEEASYSFLGLDGNPDLYIALYDGNGDKVFKYNESDPNTAVYFSNEASLPTAFAPSTNLELKSETYTLKVFDSDYWDGDGIDADDPLGEVTFYGNSPGTTSASATLNGYSGQLKVEFNIINTAIAPIVVSDTIEVYSVPTVNVTTNTPLEFCEGDSVTLISDLATGNQWYGDTALIFGADSTELKVYESGSYYVIVTNQYGCADTSSIQTVVANENPPTPTYWYYNDTLWTSLTGYDLQWYIDGVAIFGATNSFCPITASGTYTIIATSDAGCYTESFGSTYTYYPPTSGIEDIQNLIHDINIFPNPSSGQFNVTFNVETEQDLSIVVEDVIGNIVFNIPLVQAHGQINQNIDITNLAKGLYYAGINIDNQQLRRKIIIQ